MTIFSETMIGKFISIISHQYEKIPSKYKEWLIKQIDFLRYKKTDVEIEELNFRYIKNPFKDRYFLYIDSAMDKEHLLKKQDIKNQYALMKLEIKINFQRRNNQWVITIQPIFSTNSEDKWLKNQASQLKNLYPVIITDSNELDIETFIEELQETINNEKS